MASYVTFFRYTGEAWRRMVDAPENRGVAARRLIESVGGRMEYFCWMFGDWDGFVVYEVPDAATAATFSGVVTASGLIEQVSTNQILGSDDVRAALEKAREAQQAYVPPGGQGDWRSEYDVLG